ncbi:MAG: N-6 DNA methylase [Bacteroidota bacterium]
MDLKQFIEKLGFEGNLFTYSKEYKHHSYTIKVDLQKGKIFYRKDEKTTVERESDGQIQLGDYTTSNISAPESLVVLECVNRLLEKGYAPNDIHLERKWKVGHGASGGKADINVYNKSNGKTLLIIECKTWGEEFDKEKFKMEDHGGQLFSYLNQDKNSQFLVLYASKFENDEFVYSNLIVQVKDRKEDLEKSLKQIEEENIKLYRDAKNKSELFDVWKESFNKYFHFNGVFDTDTNAYSLELKALKKKNLKQLDDSTGLFNKFAEILRHNNISDNANAFNKILSLLLCKIVDEEKNDEDVLDFQVKEDEEYEHIIDRLQALYRKGMKKLNEEIVYYSENELHEIIKLYPKQTPIEKVEAIFRELKYYTNNEFAFKEVHNQNLFIQNGRVLTEVIKLIQNFRFRFTSKQQVLGDFFELMLNHGVKQSEGQFFTPGPIVRYIILSLGYGNIIETKIAKGEDHILPKILDYACGAGHFLTESLDELQEKIKQIDTSKLSTELQKKINGYNRGTEWAQDYIFGIEKDYRLARTSQIACYINGDGDANIIFGDGLEEHEQLKLNKKKFDIVVANPPYAVDAFKNYLNVGRANYDLFNNLTETSDEIETVFIERTKQVLKYGGLAGVVLPTSIFESGGIYTKAREILLKYFEIKGITILGSKTFIATNVKTLIVFLKRRDDDFVKDREYITSDLFANTRYAAEIRYIDAKRFLKMFVEYRGLELEHYERFLKLEISNELSEADIFIEYQTEFDNSSKKKDHKNKPTFMRLSTAEQDAEMKTMFYHYCKDVEKEKFFYFLLCLSDGNKNPETIEKYYDFQQTVIVKTGKEVEEQKEFLGYEFSKRKRQEGIKINNYGGKLFDEVNPYNSEKACSYIRKSIENREINTIDPAVSKYVQVFPLAELIDFDSIEFDKKISTETISKTNWEDLWGATGIKPLSPDIAIIQKGSSITKTKTVNGEIPVIAGGQQPAYFHNVSNRPEKIITVSASGAYAGFLNFWETEIFASDCTTIKSINEDEISTELLFEILKVIQPEIYKLQRGQAQPHVYPGDISKIKIPVPNREQQNAIKKDLTKLNSDRGKYLAQGVTVQDLEKVLQEEKKKIIIKHCFEIK